MLLYPRPENARFAQSVSFKQKLEGVSYSEIYVNDELLELRHGQAAFS